MPAAASRPCAQRLLCFSLPQRPRGPCQPPDCACRVMNLARLSEQRTTSLNNLLSACRCGFRLLFGRCLAPGGCEWCRGPQQRLRHSSHTDWSGPQQSTAQLSQGFGRGHSTKHSTSITQIGRGPQQSTPQLSQGLIGPTAKHSTGTTQIGRGPSKALRSFYSRLGGPTAKALHRHPADWSGPQRLTPAAGVSLSACRHRRSPHHGHGGRRQAAG
jgi:hypothetical protein